MANITVGTELSLRRSSILRCFLKIIFRMFLWVMLISVGEQNSGNVWKTSPYTWPVDKEKRSIRRNLEAKEAKTNPPTALSLHTVGTVCYGGFFDVHGLPGRLPWQVQLGDRVQVWVSKIRSKGPWLVMDPNKARWITWPKEEKKPLEHGHRT